MPTVSTKLRVTAAALALGAATVTPAVANAMPAVPLPQAALGATLGGDAVAPCDPETELCVAEIGASAIQTPLFWFGPANPNFVPLFGITFPNFFGLNFEACVGGAGIHLSPYTGGGFVGLGLGC